MREALSLTTERNPQRLASLGEIVLNLGFEDSETLLSLREQLYAKKAQVEQDIATVQEAIIDHFDKPFRQESFVGNPS